MPMFLYPLELRVGDKIAIREEDQITLEYVTALPERQGERVFVYTDKRLLQCDPGLKVQISVQRGPDPDAERKNAALNKPEEK